MNATLLCIRMWEDGWTFPAQVMLRLNPTHTRGWIVVCGMGLTKLGLITALAFTLGCTTTPREQLISDGEHQYRLVVHEHRGSDGFVRIALYERVGETNGARYMTSQNWKPGDEVVMMRVTHP